MPQLSFEQRVEIAVHTRAGKSVRSIANIVGCSTRTVHKWAQASRSGLGCVRKSRSVKKVLISEEAGTRAIELLKGESEGGARFVARQLHSEGRVARVPSRQTVVRAAKKASADEGTSLRYLRGRPKKGLTAVNKAQRRAFCKGNANRAWKSVMFTDRCKFHFRYPGCKVQRGRWVNAGEEEERQVVQPNHPQCYNVYGGLTAYSTTKLIPVTGTSGMKTTYKNQKGAVAQNITGSEYKDVVGGGLLPAGEGIFSSQFKGNWVLQQDGDPTHRQGRHPVGAHNARPGTKVEILQHWPGNSPDLSPIENVWAIVDAKVAAMGCKTFPEFKKAIDKTFQNLPRDTCRKLIESVPKRLKLCLDKDGGRIKY